MYSSGRTVWAFIRSVLVAAVAFVFLWYIFAYVGSKVRSSRADDVQRKLGSTANQLSSSKSVSEARVGIVDTAVHSTESGGAKGKEVQGSAEPLDSSSQPVASLELPESVGAPPSVERMDQISPAWVRHFADRCAAHSKEDCARILALATRIAGTAEQESSDWQAMIADEIEIYLQTVASHERILRYQVLCSAEGCLVVLSGGPDMLLEKTLPEVRPFRANRFLLEMRSEPWARHEMAWPRRPDEHGGGGVPGYFWDDAFLSDAYTVLYLFEREHSQGR